MNDYKCWSKEISTPESTKSVRVEEIDNGFIVSFCEYKNSNSEKYEEPKRKKFYPKENPLADMEPEVTENNVKDFFNPPIFQD